MDHIVVDSEPSAHEVRSSPSLACRCRGWLLFGAVVGVHLAQLDDRTERLDVVAVALGLGVDVADVVSDVLLVRLQRLNALNYGAKLAGGDLARIVPGGWRRLGASVGDGGLDVAHGTFL